MSDGDGVCDMCESKWRVARERTPESAASPSLRSLPEKPTMEAVRRLETSLESTSMPPRRAMATTVNVKGDERALARGRASEGADGRGRTCILLPDIDTNAGHGTLWFLLHKRAVCAECTLACRPAKRQGAAVQGMAEGKGQADVSNRSASRRAREQLIGSPRVEARTARLVGPLLCVRNQEERCTHRICVRRHAPTVPLGKEGGRRGLRKGAIS